MDSIGNLLWIIFGGFLVFLIYLFGSLLLILTIVGIPFGLQTLKLATFALLPFGRRVVHGERASGCLYIIMNVIWLVCAGIELAVVHLVLAFIFAITIIGLPFSVQHMKLAFLALMPFGADIKDEN